MPRSPLRMPKMSMTMEEGELGAWHVAVGDTVELGQVMCEVATDKVDMEVEATAAGTVAEIVVEPGTVVPVGAELAWIDSDSDSLLDDLLDGDPAPAATQPDQPGPEPTEPEPTEPEPAQPEPAQPEPAQPEPAEPARTGIVPAIPAARRMAAEASLDLASVTGSGPRGAVMVDDVLRVIDTELDRSEPASAPEPAVPAVTAEPAAPAVQATPEPVAGGTAEPAVPPAGDQAAWAFRAAALAPRTADLSTPPTAWRDVLLGPATELPAATLTAALGVALARALAADPPTGDARWTGVIQHPRIGFAVSTAAGPVVVTITDLHRTAFPDALRLVSSAVESARSGTVDVALLAGPDAVLSLVPEADRVSVPAGRGAAVSIAAGAASARAVAVGTDLAVRTVVTLSASPAAELGDVAWAGRLLGRMAADLPALTGLRPPPKAG